jgi:hypothetical protein
MYVVLRVLVGQPEGQRTLGSHGFRWEGKVFSKSLTSPRTVFKAGRLQQIKFTRLTLQQCTLTNTNNNSATELLHVLVYYSGVGIVSLSSWGSFDNEPNCRTVLEN